VRSLDNELENEDKSGFFVTLSEFGMHAETFELTRSNSANVFVRASL